MIARRYLYLAIAGCRRAAWVPRYRVRLRSNVCRLVIQDRRPQAHAGWYSKVNGPRTQLLKMWAAMYQRRHPAERGPVNVL